MNKNFKTGAQGGFTLIELIVVIVILGILAATALPKFVSLGGDARAATVQAAKGALNSTSAMAHGKYLMNPASGKDGASFTAEGAKVTFKNGYPAADAGLVAAAGLSDTDFKTDTKTAGTVKVYPASLDGTSAAATCYVSYTEAAANATPTITAVTTTCE